jgi:hypothetical protein
MRRWSLFSVLVELLALLAVSKPFNKQKKNEFNIGIGIHDVTGPIAGINLMGFHIFSSNK